MKKLALVLVLLISICFQAKADVAVVTGTVQLKAAKSNFPTALEDEFTGRDSSLPTSKKGKKISVTGDYTGDKVLRLVEDITVADDADKYFIDVPIPSVVNFFTSKTKKATSKLGSVKVQFSSADEIAGNSSNDDDSVGDLFGSNNSLIKIFKAKKKKGGKKIGPLSSVSNTLSVKKIVASRKGYKAKVVGTFNNDNKAARGRFVLKFNFAE